MSLVSCQVTNVGAARMQRLLHDRAPGRSRSTRAAMVLALMVVSVISISSPVFSQQGRPQRRAQNPAFEHYYQMAREVFRPDRAFDIVAFMDDLWRLPGNTGYDAAIGRVEQELLEAGYLPEESAGGHPFTYRIEHRPLSRPAWDPINGSLTIVGEDESLLHFHSNFNLIAANSYSTPPEGVTGELVFVGAGRTEDFEGIDVAGKIVMGTTSVDRLFREAVQNRGALGVLSWSMPAYNRPEIYRHAIQFSSIPYDPEREAWGFRLSLAAFERLQESLAGGRVQVRVMVEARLFESEELTLVADIHGSQLPDERFVFSAHVQEPGANDNASGVATQSEMACAVPRMVAEGMPLPGRSISFIWGDEISSTGRYLRDEPERTAGVRWGISLDMVGENTSLTGGSFLIEKMPDPSAIVTRGQDSHTEWFGSRRPMNEDQLTPHYFNDFVLSRCLDQAAVSRWVVKTNPYEGGSDHVPFLRADVPGLLLWHFTDYFYHTDADRLNKVSATEMRNVGISALVSALVLASADEAAAIAIVEEVTSAALRRLDTEFELSREAIEGGGDAAAEVRIVRLWRDWYAGAIREAVDIETGGSSSTTLRVIEECIERVIAHGTRLIELLEAGG